VEHTSFVARKPSSLSLTETSVSLLPLRKEKRLKQPRLETGTCQQEIGDHFKLPITNNIKGPINQMKCSAPKNDW
jgi:hypothetical protein